MRVWCKTALEVARLVDQTPISSDLCFALDNQFQKFQAPYPWQIFFWRHSYVSLSDSSQLMTSKNNICLSWICVCIALDRAYGPNWPFRFRFYSFLYPSKLLWQFFTVGLCRFKMWDAITFVVITRLCQLNKGENKSFNL